MARNDVFDGKKPEIMLDYVGQTFVIHGPLKIRQTLSSFLDMSVSVSAPAFFA